ncbi:MAG: helix-turn-helix transcriptional regulator [Saprospiraceae bacterium]|nr:helix-turn-helix transcriptional regulator [Saprospiraceae bacterium]
MAAYQATRLEHEHHSSPLQILKEEHLSERELEVLDLVVHGLTSEEISSQLYISTSTVISHRKNMQRKMNARNSAHLVFLVCKLGLL